MGECTMLNTNGQEEQVHETDRTEKERVFTAQTGTETEIIN